MSREMLAATALVVLGGCAEAGTSLEQHNADMPKYDRSNAAIDDDETIADQTDGLFVDTTEGIRCYIDFSTVLDENIVITRLEEPDAHACKEGYEIKSDGLPPHTAEHFSELRIAWEEKVQRIKNEILDIDDDVFVNVTDNVLWAERIGRADERYPGLVAVSMYGGYDPVSGLRSPGLEDVPYGPERCLFIGFPEQGQPLDRDTARSLYVAGMYGNRIIGVVVDDNPETTCQLGDIILLELASNQEDDRQNKPRGYVPWQEDQSLYV